MSYELRPYQAEAVSALFSYFGMHRGNPIVVMPTGSGKSLVIADFLRRAVEGWGARVTLLSHVKEILEQNLEKIAPLLPRSMLGVNSASLGRREYGRPVTVAGIQSVHRGIEDGGPQDLVIVDECHLVPHDGDGMYRRALATLWALNPKVKVVGFTATPFRMKGGYLHRGDDAVFTHIAHSVPMNRLVEEGWLSPLVSKLPENVISTEGVKVTAGEYNRRQLEDVAGEPSRVAAAVEELVAKGAERRSWLLFGCGIKHAQLIRDAVRRQGISAELLTGGTDHATRRRLIAAHREGRIRALVNVNVLTTGFDNPRVDLLGVMRPTRSTALYVQMMGRGSRIAPGKRDCLVLDFGGNVERHGPVNNVQVPPGPAPDGEVMTAPAKTCPECLEIQHAALLTCQACGFEFPPRESDHGTSASTADVIAEREVVELDVDHVSYSRHRKHGKPDSVRVQYLCGIRPFSEWVCLEHGGNAAVMARRWWAERAGTEPPATTGEALERIRSGHEVRQPSRIRVEIGSKYPRILARLDVAR